VGAETLELVAVLPLLGLVLMVAWQAILLVRGQIQAQADARELARRAVLCSRAAPPLRLADVDPQGGGTAQLAALPGHPDMLRVEVRLGLPAPVPGMSLDAASTLAPHAVVVMRREPC
jgi:hypothetical protein